MMNIVKRFMSHGHGKNYGKNGIYGNGNNGNNHANNGDQIRNLIQCIIPNPPGFQATNTRVLSKHGRSEKVDSSIIHDHSDQTSKVLVTYPDKVQIKVDVFYETLSTIGFLHGDLQKPMVLSYSLFGKTKPKFVEKK